MFEGAELKLSKPRPWTADLGGNVELSLSSREHFPMRNVPLLPPNYMVIPYQSQKKLKVEQFTGTSFSVQYPLSDRLNIIICPAFLTDTAYLS